MSGPDRVFLEFMDVYRRMNEGDDFDARAEYAGILRRHVKPVHFFIYSGLMALMLCILGTIEARLWRNTPQDWVAVAAFAWGIWIIIGCAATGIKWALWRRQAIEEFDKYYQSWRAENDHHSDIDDRGNPGLG